MGSLISGIFSFFQAEAEEIQEESPIQKMPAEIMMAIVAYVQRKDLAALAQTSHWGRAVAKQAERHFYLRAPKPCLRASWLKRPCMAAINVDLYFDALTGAEITPELATALNRRPALVEYIEALLKRKRVNVGGLIGGAFVDKELFAYLFKLFIINLPVSESVQESLEPSTDFPMGVPASQLLLLNMCIKDLIVGSERVAEVALPIFKSKISALFQEAKSRRLVAFVNLGPNTPCHDELTGYIEELTGEGWPHMTANYSEAVLRAEGLTLRSQLHSELGPKVNEVFYGSRSIGLTNGSVS